MKEDDCLRVKENDCVADDDDFSVCGVKRSPTMVVMMEMCVRTTISHKSNNMDVVDL